MIIGVTPMGMNKRIMMVGAEMMLNQAWQMPMRQICLHGNLGKSYYPESR